MKTRTPGNYGRPQNPDHILNDDLKDFRDVTRKYDWGIADEIAVDEIRWLHALLWQTRNPEERKHIINKIERANIRLSVANEIGRRANLIWNAEQKHDEEKREADYKQDLAKAVQALQEQSNGAPYYFSHTWALEQGFSVSHNDIEDAVLPPEPKRGGHEFDEWSDQASKIFIYDSIDKPDINSPVFGLVIEARRRAQAGIKPGFPEDPNDITSRGFYDSENANIADMICQPQETWCEPEKESTG